MSNSLDPGQDQRSVGSDLAKVIRRQQKLLLTRKGLKILEDDNAILANKLTFLS